MGKRVAIAALETHYVTPPCSRPSVRKRKRNSSSSAVAAKSHRLHAYDTWHENDDEDSLSSTDTPPILARNHSHKQANNSSILLNTSAVRASESSPNESPKPVYTLRPSVVNGTILYDLNQKPWRLGRPIGKGNFGEIFLASDNITIPVTHENARYVVKIEPHSNGPLFVEIHCLMNTAKKQSSTDDDPQRSASASNSSLLYGPPSGIPDYIGSGSHNFGNARYRFLVLPRFDCDLHSLIRNSRVHQKYVLALGVQVLDVLENLHDRGYCHNDVKAQNLMISKCKYLESLGEKTAPAVPPVKSTPSSSSLFYLDARRKYREHCDEKHQTTDSGNSSEQEANDDDEDFAIRRKAFHHPNNTDDREDDYDDEDFDDGETTNSNNSHSLDAYRTPVNNGRSRRCRNATVIEFSGSNPVRSCRVQKRNSTYEEMVKSHYLRPTKRVSYSEFFESDTVAGGLKADATASSTSDAESEDFIPRSVRRSVAAATSGKSAALLRRPLTRQQEKLLTAPHDKHSHKTAAAGSETAASVPPSVVVVEKERIFLIDYGLASRYIERGEHRPFIMDQRRAHDGTLEFTSRDAHMGAHSRRSDLECLGYNLIFWSQGYLPWKTAATQQQQEKVHRAKEYLMTDVREMLKQIYGKQVPKYLGEFLHLVGKLAYNERPDYDRYRRIFQREFQQQLRQGPLHSPVAEAVMGLDSADMARTCVRVKEEIENKNDFFEMNKLTGGALDVIRNLSVGTPFHDSTFCNRVSPKNLRSKSDKKVTKKKKFSWAEILSEDPDQIARDRAIKEYDRQHELNATSESKVRRYEGNPTYAILEIQKRLRERGRLVYDPNENSNMATEDDEGEVDGEQVDDDDDEDDEEESAEENEEDDDDDDEEMEGEDEADGSEEIVEEEKEEDEDESAHDEDSSESYGRATFKRRGGRKSVNALTTQKSCKKSSAKTPATTRTTTATTAAPAATTTTAKKRGRPRKSAVVAFSTKTRSSASTAVTATATATAAVAKSHGKRSSATVRNGRGKEKSRLSAASAAGEADHHVRVKYLPSGGVRGGGGGGCNNNGTYGGGGGESGDRPPERRTRRCLIKTDGEEENSNSNFSPDVRSLFNVWKKFDNEPTMYYRGTGGGGGGGATRHYRK